MDYTTLADAVEAYLQHLREQGKKTRTLYTYAKDFELICDFFGGEKPLASIRSAQVGKFFKSNGLLKKASGEERAKATVDKTKRVLRMFLVWAVETGRMSELPLPKGTPMGHSNTDCETTNDE